MRSKQWLLGVTFAAALAPASGYADYALRILHTNDVHARYDQTMADGSTCTAKGLSAGKCLAGAARLAAQLTAWRAQGNVIYLDAGDQFQGTLFYNRYKEQAPLRILGLLKPDAITLGNHEFDDGPAVTARYIKALKLPVVAANIDVSGETAFAEPLAPSTILSVGGQRIGVIGLTTVETPITSSPGKSVAFMPEEDALRAATAALQAQGVNKIIALTHIGYADDVALAGKVNGVDIFVGGHSHTLLSNTDPKASGPYPTVTHAPSGDPVLVVQAGFAGLHLGRLDVTFDDNGVIKAWSGDAALLTADIPPDPSVAAAVAEMEAPLAALRAQTVGQLPSALSNADCRARECALGDLVADAILTAARGAGAEIALTNGGGLRAGLPEGTVTMGDVLEVLPFSNTVAWADVTGAALTADLENGVSRANDMNLPGTGRFPQVSGLRFAFDPLKPAGSRIGRIEVRTADGSWTPLDPARTYRVATNNFTRAGGDDYRGLAAAKTFYDFGINLEAAVAGRLAQPDLATTLDGRILRLE